MFDDEPAIGAKPSRKRKKRVQSRSLPPTDIWDREQQDFVDGDPSSKRHRPWRKAWLTLQFVCFLAIGLSVPYLVKSGYDHFYVHNAELALTNLAYSTDGSLTQEKVIEVGGIKIGVSLAGLDLDDLKDRITEIPQVRTAIVERQFPDSLIIKVTERQPVAWLSSPIHQIRPLRKGGLLIDENAVVFKCHQLIDSSLTLPTIEMNPEQAPQEGSSIEAAMINCGLRLIESAPQLKQQFGLELVDIRPVGNWGLLCRYSNNLLATFDLSQLDRGQRNLIDILETTQAKGLELATINLAPAKNIPITFKTKNVEDKR